MSNQQKPQLTKQLEWLASRCIDKESGDYDPIFPKNIGNWSPIKAWNAPWQTIDTAPPIESKHNNWLVRMNLPLPTPLQNLLEVMAEGHNTSEQNAQRKLHRYGAPETARIVLEEFLTDSDATIADFRDGAKIAKGFVSGESQGYEELDKTADIESSFNRRSRRSYSVVWWQHTLFEVISIQLGVSQNAAFRMSLAIAGADLEPGNHLPEPLYRDLTHLAQIYRTQAQARAEWFKDAFNTMMHDASDEGNLNGVVSYLFKHHPTLTWEYLEDISEQYNDHAQINPIAIAKLIDVHPLDASARISSLFPGASSPPNRIVVDGRQEFLPSPPPIS